MPSVRHMCCGPRGVDECFTASSWPCKFHLLSKTLNVNMRTKPCTLAASQSELTPFFSGMSHRLLSILQKKNTFCFVLVSLSCCCCKLSCLAYYHNLPRHKNIQLSAIPRCWTLFVAMGLGNTALSFTTTSMTDEFDTRCWSCTTDPVLTHFIQSLS